jgi:hypothetical protein
VEHRAATFGQPFPPLPERLVGEAERPARAKAQASSPAFLAENAGIWVPEKGIEPLT